MGEGGLDLGRAAGEGSPHARVDSGEVGPSTLELAPRDTQAARELGAQLRLVEVPGRAQLEEQPTRVECRPATVRSRCQVRDEHVAVKVGVGRAADSVEKRRGHKAAGRDRGRCFAACQAAPDAGATALQIPERGRCGFLVASAYLRSHVLGT